MAFIRYVARTVSALTDREQFIWIFIGIGVGISSMNLWLHPAIASALIFGVCVGAFLSMAIFTIITRRQMRRMSPSDDSYMFGPQETLLEDEGVKQSSAHHEAVFQWSLVRAIGITDQHIFVMVDRIAGIILPKRAFASEEECEQFVSEIERRSGKLR